MGIHFNLKSSRDAMYCDDAPCFARLKYGHRLDGQLQYVHYFPFSSGDGDCRLEKKFGCLASNNLPAVRAWWEHVLSKRFIYECLEVRPTVDQVLNGRGFKVKCNISHRRMMVVLSILRAPEVVFYTKVNTFTRLLVDGIEPDVAFIMAQIVCQWEDDGAEGFYQISLVPDEEHDVFSPAYMTSDDVSHFFKVWTGDYKKSDLPRAVSYAKHKTYQRFPQKNPKAITRYFATSKERSCFKDCFLTEAYKIVKDRVLYHDIQFGNLRGSAREFSSEEINVIAGLVGVCREFHDV
jgi:hypothetical protein